MSMLHDFLRSDAHLPDNSAHQTMRRTGSNRVTCLAYSPAPTHDGDLLKVSKDEDDDGVTSAVSDRPAAPAYRCCSTEKFPQSTPSTKQ